MIQKQPLYVHASLCVLPSTCGRRSQVSRADCMAQSSLPAPAGQSDVGGGFAAAFVDRLRRHDREILKVAWPPN
jgi:hypothetical protein